jgi:DNA replication protein DnaC
VAQSAQEGQTSTSLGRIPYSPVCATCEDFRWVHRLDEHGNWPKREQPGFGKLDPCPDCTATTVAEAEAAKTASLFNGAGFSGVKVKSLEDFDTARQATLKGRTAAELALRSIVEWAGGGGPQFLLLTGGTGVGKTHLSEGAAAMVIERGDPIVYVIWADFVFGFRENLDERHEHMRRLRDAEYLILDEILAARDTTQFLTDELQDLLGHRTHFNKPTLLAGNLVPEGDTESARKQWWIDRVGERFVSRMTDKTMVKVVNMFDCDDLRPHEQGELTG